MARDGKRPKTGELTVEKVNAALERFGNVECAAPSFNMAPVTLYTWIYEHGYVMRAKRYIAPRDQQAGD